MRFLFLTTLTLLLIGLTSAIPSEAQRAPIPPMKKAQKKAKPLPASAHQLGEAGEDASPQLGAIFEPESGTFAYIDRKRGEARLYEDLAKKGSTRSRRIAAGGTPSELAFKRVGEATYLVMVSFSGLVEVFDLEDHERVFQHRMLTNENSFSIAAAESPKDPSVYVTIDDTGFGSLGHITRINLATKKADKVTLKGSFPRSNGVFRVNQEGSRLYIGDQRALAYGEFVQDGDVSEVHLRKVVEIQNAVIDPLGRVINGGTKRFTQDLEYQGLSLFNGNVGFLRDRAYSLSVNRFDRSRIYLQSLNGSDPKFFGSPQIKEREHSVTKMFHHVDSGYLLFLSRTHVFRCKLKDLRLSSDRYLGLEVKGSKQCPIGEESSLTLEKTFEKDSTITLEKAVKGLQLDGERLTFSPDKTQFGKIELTFKISKDKVERKQTLTLDVGYKGLELPFLVQSLLQSPSGRYLALQGVAPEFAGATPVGRNRNPGPLLYPLTLALLDLKEKRIVATRQIDSYIEEMVLSDKHLALRPRLSKEIRVYDLRTLEFAYSRIFDTKVNSTSNTGNYFALLGKDTLVATNAKRIGFDLATGARLESGDDYHLLFGNDALLVRGQRLHSASRAPFIFKGVDRSAVDQVMRNDEGKITSLASLPIAGALASKSREVYSDGGKSRRSSQSFTTPIVEEDLLAPHGSSKNSQRRGERERALHLASFPAHLKLETKEEEVEPKDPRRFGRTITRQYLRVLGIQNDGELESLVVAETSDQLSSRERVFNQIYAYGHRVALFNGESISFIELEDQSGKPKPKLGFGYREGVVSISAASEEMVTHPIDLRSSGSPTIFALGKTFKGAAMEQESPTLKLQRDETLRSAAAVLLANLPLLSFSSQAPMPWGTVILDRLDAYQQATGAYFNVLLGRESSAIVVPLVCEIRAESEEGESAIRSITILVELDKAFLLKQAQAKFPQLLPRANELSALEAEVKALEVKVAELERQLGVSPEGKVD